MGFNCGIVGLPNVGKSTLFNAVTAAGAAASNYPFCTIDPNIGVVPVPDARLDVLAGLYHPARIVPSTIEFVDIAGLVRGASRGEGLGNQFLGHIRDVDAIAHVVRCFDDPDVIHVNGNVDPKSDIEIVEAELILKDLETVERALGEVVKRARGGDRKLKDEADLYAQLRDHLRTGRLAQYAEFRNDEVRHMAQELHLLTMKPVMYVCNVREDAIAGGHAYVDAVSVIAAAEGARVVRLCAKVEAEVAELPAGERTAYLESLGLPESGLIRFVREGYGLLHLITFFTVNPKELHAWTLREGGTAIDAAGRIHTDFARGFIRAEIMRFEDLARLGSEHLLREQGLLHVEGRDHPIRDGDVVYVRFNV